MSERKVSEAKIFTVPFSLGEIQENLKITTNAPYKASKEQIINHAINIHLQGKILEAAKYYQDFIDHGFEDHRIFSNYGIILRNLGQRKEAELSLRKAIELNPNFAEGYSNLGNLLRDLNNLKEAELFTRKAIDLNPNLANAHSNLGIILRDLGNLKEAELSSRKAINLNPSQADAHSNLGIIMRDLGNLKEAELSSRKAIDLNPNLANAYSNLGNIFNDLGNLKAAELYIRKAIRIKPDFAEAYSNLGNVLNDLGNLEEAELFTRKAIEISPNLAEAYSNLGNILNNLGNLKEAELYIRKAIQINPNLTDVYFNLFRHYEEINDLENLDKALKEFSKVDNIKNELLLFNSRLSFRNKEYKTAKKYIDSVSSKWIRKNNNKSRLIFWNYKAFIEDKVGNYDTAYFSFEKSQQDSKYNNFNKKSFLNFIYSYKESIKDRNVKLINNDFNEYNLAFLIGFPRSGTTLLDTILRSHPKIEVIEEKPLISIIEYLIKKRFNSKIENIYRISEDNKMILRKKYFELLSKYIERKEKLIIDKFPLNTVSIPLINLLFPKAKIIFAHRHPYDTTLSCFQQSFEPNEAMANFVSLKSSSRMYDQVMCSWDIYKTNLSLDFITSKYEDLIENFDNNILKILDFLGVGWDNNIRKYRQTALNRGRINTPSSSQVVQPIYKASIKKWKNYEKYFEECHQYLEKWVSYFDY